MKAPITDVACYDEPDAFHRACDDCHFRALSNALT